MIPISYTAKNYDFLLFTLRNFRPELTELTLFLSRSISPFLLRKGYAQLYLTVLLLREKYSYLGFFWSVFSRIRTAYREIRCLSPYSFRMWENKDQNISDTDTFHSVSGKLQKYCKSVFEWLFFNFLNSFSGLLTNGTISAAEKVYDSSLSNIYNEACQIYTKKTSKYYFYDGLEWCIR